jgi:hypothetical protein
MGMSGAKLPTFLCKNIQNPPPAEKLRAGSDFIIYKKGNPRVLLPPSALTSYSVRAVFHPHLRFLMRVIESIC